MLIDGVRIRWGVSRSPREIVCTFSVGEACARYTVPFATHEGVSSRVTELIDLLANSGVLDTSARAIAIGNARDEFTQWGYRWESAS